MLNVLLEIISVVILVANRMGRRTSIEKREIVVKHYKEGKTQKAIAEIVDLSPSTVQYIIQRFVRENRIADKGRKSPNKIFNEADERWIIRKVKQDPKISAPYLAAEAEKYLGKRSNPETIRRILREHDFHGRTARNKPFISAKNKKLRIQFATEYLGKTDTFWDTVIFSDESKYNLFGSNGKVSVWRKPNAELQIQNLRGTVKHGGGHVMVWGCMSSSGVGSLHCIEGNMDKFQYLNILKANILQSAEKLGIRENFSFYQDNDPKHKSGIVQTYLIYNCPHMLQTPPQSPDINVIENLWHLLETKIRLHNISNLNDLKEALKTEWYKISPAYTKKLVSSMNSRLRSVIKQKGYPTKY